MKDSVITVPKGGGFADMVALKGDKEIGDKINKIIGKFAEANELKGVVDRADFNDEDKLDAARRCRTASPSLCQSLMDSTFEPIEPKATTFGDAYEYLMRHFATESGKSKGQFYTPAEVSRVMAKVVGIGSETAQIKHSMTRRGSGSLLIKAADEASRHHHLWSEKTMPPGIGSDEHDSSRTSDRRPLARKYTRQSTF